MSKSVVALTTALLVWPGTGWAQAPHRADADILIDVVAAVNRHPAYTIFDDVETTVREAVVTVAGWVTTGYTRDAIEQRLATIAGVRSIRNEIRVLAASPADDALRRQIARSIYGNSSLWQYAMLPHPPIHIVVQRGHVRLTGTVENDADRGLARALAMQSSALSVTDEMRTGEATQIRGTQR
jgi:hyperosmotically inducible protein